MKGKVLDFSVQTNGGVISGEDGRRYKFSGGDWKSPQSPRQGQAVDFEVQGDQATSIYPETGSAGGSSGMSATRLTAALLAFFLGVFGAHKFYLGMKQPAIIMLVVSVAGFILFGIPTFVMWVISIIEFILYLTKSDEEFEQIYVIGKKPWF